MEDNRFMEIVAAWLQHQPAIFMFLLGLALVEVTKVIRLTGKVWQVLKYLEILAEKKGDMTLEEIIEEGK